VRIAVDLEEFDPAPPSDPSQLAALLDVEERLGAADPYRQLGQLAHLILRKPDTAVTPANDDPTVRPAPSSRRFPLRPVT
jgi:hypothetical protein